MLKSQQKEKSLVVSFAIVYYILVASCVASFIPIDQSTNVVNHHHHHDNHEATISNNNLASATNYHHLLRVKRQQSSSLNGGQAPGSNANSNNQVQPGGSSSSSSDGSTNPQDATNPDEKPPEETLSSLKCDFGTSEAPDLCKFKIIEPLANPLAKGRSNWGLGSGKLALYQGGPLIDASDRNDTTGGYIFYETSNPYTNTMNQTIGPHMYDSPLATPAGGQAATTNPHHEHYDYSTISFMKSTHRTEHLMNTHDSSNFQQVSSARVAVGTGGAINNLGPAIMSPNLTAPGPSGMCLSFQYAIQGLSAEELRIYVNDHKTERSRQIWSSTESAAGNWTRGEVLYSVTNTHSLTFSASSSSSQAKDLQQRKFRGHIALDEIEVNRHDPSGNEGACRGHCNFDGDLCGWTNAENGQEDDFEWTFGRGSDNLFTGPPRDYVSSTNNELTGSYLHTDSGYPRRPGDRAVLVSPMFQPTAVNDAMCMRLAVHMFGSGIGSLAIKIRYADEAAAGDAAASASPQAAPGQSGANGPLAAAPSATRADGGRVNNDLVIWEMSGDAGNSWHQAQTSVSSSKSPFQVLIEGVIGENHLGNIAIDEISFSSGPCPTSPPVASKNYGDCTFEQSMCYWRNPDAEIHLDDLDWIRSADEQSIHGPNFDHTLKKRSGSYLKLENTFREPKSGSRAFLLSPIFQPKAQGSVQCLSFYYYMFMRSIGSSGPNLGTIRVYLASNNELVPIWRLTNPISSPNWKHGRASLSTALIDGQPTAPTKLFQIAFEGIWGDAAGGAIALDDITVFDGACDIMPPEAKSVPGECTFDVDMCSWMNKTSDVMTSSLDSTDSSRSPFLQSVSNSASAASGYTPARIMSPPSSKRMSWQLATVDSRPVNLQDHTYKAPVGYTYVDVLDGQRMFYPLQSADITVQAGQQVVQCLSFWFAAYGRQESNQLNVYLTQASAPPPPAEEGAGSSSLSSSGSLPRPGSRLGGNQSGNQFSSSSSNTSGQLSGSSSSTSSANNSPSPVAVSSSAAGGSGSGGGGGGGGTDSETENPNAWKSIDGKLLWSITSKNITEMNRRKWQYGQVTLKADSNYIVRFVAVSSDGGFALDDISYYEGACETRPAAAKVQQQDEEDSSSGNEQPSGAPKS